MVKFKNVMSCILITALMYIVSRCVPIFILDIFPGKLLIYCASMLLFLLAGWYIAGSISKWKHPKCIKANLILYCVIEGVSLIRIVPDLLFYFSCYSGGSYVDINGIAYSDYLLLYGGAAIVELLYLWLCWVLNGETRNRFRTFNANDESVGNQGGKNCKNSPLSDIKAMGDVQKIKNGGIANLSTAQIVNLIINLPDARAKLSEEEYSQIHELYKEMRKCTTKIPMDMNFYCDTAVKIILEFDKIAPYEKYSGGNEIEFSFMMADIYGKNHERIRELKRYIYQFEKQLAESDAIYANNKKILSETLTDEELQKRVSAGQFQASRVDEYIDAREALKVFVDTAPEIRADTVGFIEDMKKELASLQSNE